MAREQGGRARPHPRAAQGSPKLTAAAALLACLLALALPARAQAGGERDAILLVAAPELLDPNFHETVVLVTRHRGTAGPLGVIINRPTTVALERALPEIASLAGQGEKVWFGGPVAPRALFYVFRASAPAEGAIPVAEGVYLDWDGDRLKALLARDKPMEGLRIYAGHSAWAPGQLEAEVARGSWKSARPEERIIFSTRPETVWSELERRSRATTAGLPGGHP